MALKAVRPVLLAALFVGLIHSLLVSFYRAEVAEVPRNTEIATPRLTERVLLVVVDGLRYDTAFESGCMPHLQQLSREHVSGISISTAITMTSVGVKAIGAGISSGLGSIAHNWNPSPVEFDNIFEMLKARGSRIGQVGNHTWIDLFGRYLDSNTKQRRMADIFHMIDPIYGSDILWSRQAVQLAKANYWEFAIVHLGGLDNASHLWTPFSRLFCDKAQSIDQDLRQIFEGVGAQTTIIVTSDHGTSNSGHHGSGEPEARRTPLLLLGPGVIPSGKVEARQQDIAPTIAVLLGLPIPAPVEGRVLTEVLDLSAADAQRTVAANLRQAQRYAAAVAQRDGFEVPRLASAGDLLPWLEQVRSGSANAPLLWAFALALCACSLFLDGGRRGIRPIFRHWQISVGWLLGIGAFEWVIAEWRIHNRAVEIAWGHATSLLGAGKWTALALLAAAAGLLLSLAARRLEGRSRLALTISLFALSAVGDSLIFPISVAFMVAAASLAGSWPLRILSVVALATSESVILFVPREQLQSVATVGFLAPLLIAGLTALYLRPKRDNAFLLLAVLLVASLAAVLRAGLVPTEWLHGYLYFSLALVAGHGLLAKTRKQLLAITACSAICLVSLSTNAQIPGIIGIIIMLAIIGAELATAPTTSALLVTVLALVGSRILFIQLFEGGFSFSSFEIQLGYLANPGQNHFVGTITVAAKFFLPMFLSVGLLTATLPSTQRLQALLGCLAFYAFRLFHICLSMVVARDTFYSPYSDSGHLVFHLLFFISIGLIAILGLTSRAMGRTWREPTAKPGLR